MPREDIGPIPRAEIDLAVARLDALKIHIQQVQKWFEANDEEGELWVWRYKSLERGLVALETLPAEFLRAMHAHSRGNPQNAESSKARSTKKSVDKKLSQADQAIAKSKAKKTKPKE